MSERQYMRCSVCGYEYREYYRIPEMRDNLHCFNGNMLQCRGVMIKTSEYIPDVPAVRAGQRWKHYKGGIYDIVAVGINEADSVPVVVYASVDMVRSVWVRPLENWSEMVGASPRFTRID